jgi:transcriptional regulator with XRE-family HTH domain
MSSEQSPSEHPPMNEWEIRAAIKLAGYTQKQIAEDTETTQSVVSMVIRGRQWERPSGRRIMERIAEIIGVPVHIVFPHSERRKRPFPNERAA